MVAQRPPVDLENRLRSVAPNTGTVIIGIDGHGGSGKSTLAGVLADRLQAECVHTDDFASWDNPKEWWPRLIDDVLEPIATGAASLSYARSQWWEGHHRAPIVGQALTPVMILEGVGSLRREFRRYISLGLYVAAPRAVCLERGILRDAQLGTPEQIAALWHAYFEAELRYMARDEPEQFAEIVVDGTKPYEKQLGLD
jgi:uridine kinase